VGPLRDACELFPRARLTVSTLRAEAARGRLDIFRIGRRDYVTPAALREMVRKCQDAARPRAFTSTDRVDNGLSATARASSALASLRQTVVGLRSNSPHTLAKSMRPNADPIR